MKSDTKRYTKQFYTRAAIERAIRDYSRIAKIRLSEDEGNYICSFSGCVVAPERVILEFDNYLIETVNSGEK